MLHRARTIILPAAAAAAWVVVIWIDVSGGSGAGRDDLCPACLAIVLTIVAVTWALIDHYYKRLTRDRQEAHAGHDVEVLAEGVAAYMRQGDGQQQPGKRA